MINNLYIPFDVSYNLDYIFLLQDLIKNNNGSFDIKDDTIYKSAGIRLTVE